MSRLPAGSYPALPGAIPGLRNYDFSLEGGAQWPSHSLMGGGLWAIRGFDPGVDLAGANLRPCLWLGPSTSPLAGLNSRSLTFTVAEE